MRIYSSSVLASPTLTLTFPGLKVLSLIVALGSLLIACSSGQDPQLGATPQAQPALAAMQKLRTGDLKGAVKDYTAAIAQEPQSAENYVNRGIAYNELGQNQLAIADYTKALDLAPNQTLAYYNRANAYSQLKQYQNAIADYTKIISQDRSYAYAYANRGSIYFQLNQKKEAFADLEKAIQIFTEKSDAKNVERLQRQLKKWRAG